MIAKLTRLGFLFLFISPLVLTSSAYGQAAGTPVTVQFHNLWVDYDVTQGDEYGMLIHISFSVQGMKSQTGEVGFRFEKDDGEYLYSNNPDYSSVEGDLTIYKTVTPGYDDTYYEDLQIFMPYWALTVGAGTHDLRIHSDLLYQNAGTKDAHLGYHEFRFTK